jgi:hypothetical protein
MTGDGDDGMEVDLPPFLAKAGSARQWGKLMSVSPHHVVNGTAGEPGV